MGRRLERAINMVFLMRAALTTTIEREGPLLEAVLEVAKQRNGSIGRIELQWVPERTLFLTKSSRQYESDQRLARPRSTQPQEENRYRGDFDDFRGDD